MARSLKISEKGRIPYRNLVFIPRLHVVSICCPFTVWSFLPRDFICVYDADSLAADATDRAKVKTLRWVYADMLGYYATTMRLLYPLHDELIAFESVLHALSSSVCEHFIDSFYNTIVDIDKHSAEMHVPLRYKNFYKFWWSQELSHLKDKAIESSKLWKNAGRPRSGPIAELRNADKRNYIKKLYSDRQAETQSYTNDLHDALIANSGFRFWKSWKCKFENQNGSGRLMIDGIADDVKIAKVFAEHFRKTCTSLVTSLVMSG